MVIVASIYLRYYIKVRVGVATFLPTPTPTPPKFLSNPTLTPQLQLGFHTPDSPAVKWSWHNANHSLHIVPRVKKHII
jgi:hypothetical protein